MKGEFIFLNTGLVTHMHQSRPRITFVIRLDPVQEQKTYDLIWIAFLLSSGIY